MDHEQALLAFAALAQPTRLEAFRRLVAAEPEGLPAGMLAADLAVPQNTMSAHLAVLSRAGLARGERRSRHIIYRADLERVRALVTFLMLDCCGGRPEVCAPLTNAPASCRPKGETCP